MTQLTKQTLYSTAKTISVLSIHGYCNVLALRYAVLNSLSESSHFIGRNSAIKTESRSFPCITNTLFWGIIFIKIVSAVNNMLQHLKPMSTLDFIKLWWMLYTGSNLIYGLKSTFSFQKIPWYDNLCPWRKYSITVFIITWCKFKFLPICQASASNTFEFLCYNNSRRKSAFITFKIRMTSSTCRLYTVSVISILGISTLSVNAFQIADGDTFRKIQVSNMSFTITVLPTNPKFFSFCRVNAVI